MDDMNRQFVLTKKEVGQIMDYKIHINLNWSKRCFN